MVFRTSCAVTALLIGVQGKNLALPPVLPRHVRKHPRQLPVGGLGNKRRIVQGVDQFPQPGPRRLLCRARNARPQPGQRPPADGPSPHQRNRQGEGAIALLSRRDTRCRLRRLAERAPRGK